MKVLVLGQGGREHALVRALRQSPSVSEVHAAPGSDGFYRECLCHQIPSNESSVVVDLVSRHDIDLVIVGPEKPLVEGWADVLRDRGVDVVGPGRQAAQIEGSKIFSKDFMNRAGLPTAKSFVVTQVAEAMERAREFPPPYVLKADGLAAGKGVEICRTLNELEIAAEQFFVEKIHGPAGERALLEEYQEGWETSVLILTNGREYQVLPFSQDHKRLGDGDIGPNTGGMGVVAPIPMDLGLVADIHRTILQPTLKQMSLEGMNYRGVLYVGLMITAQGPKVIEFNVRFGDPEAQVLLPLLDGDWGLVFKALARGEVTELRWRPLHAACVVMAAEGYPQRPQKGALVEGNLQFQTPSSYFLHAGTSRVGDGWQVAGGRVLNAIGLGSDLIEALRNAYDQAEQVSWSGMQMRSDIGEKILRTNKNPEK